PKFVSFDTTTCGLATPHMKSATASSSTPNPGDTVTLSAVVEDADNNGGCSAGQTFTYDWRLLSKPASSSSATISDPTVQAPTITPDVPGSYAFSVTATDSTGRTSNNALQVSFFATACGSAVPAINTV